MSEFFQEQLGTLRARSLHRELVRDRHCPGTRGADRRAPVRQFFFQSLGEALTRLAATGYRPDMAELRRSGVGM